MMGAAHFRSPGSVASEQTSALGGTAKDRSSSRAEPASAPRWSRYDYAFALLGLLLPLAISLRLSQGHIFWEDEMLGWMMLRDPSWSHMIRSWKLGADGGGFSFYLTGRIWFWLFGASITTFRLYSAACFGFSFLAGWAAARRVYRFGPTAFATFLVWFLCPVLLVHMAEGRFYGLLMASVAAAVYMYMRGTEIPGSGARGAPAAFCVLVFIVHALLITSHLLGVVYSFFIVLATLAMDRLQGRLRVRLYLSAAAAWLLLIPSRQSILASARVGKPHFWTMQPQLEFFVLAYAGFSIRIFGIMLLLFTVVLLSIVVSRRRRTEIFHSVPQRTRAYVIMAGLFLVPIAFYVEGMAGTPLFVDRYLLPVNVGVMLVIAEMVTLIGFPRLLRGKVGKAVSAVFAVSFALMLGQYDFFYLRQFAIQHWDYTEALTAILPKGIPVVCEDVFSFSELIGRERNSGVFYKYFLDWQNASGPRAPRLEVTQYHLMENWKKAGYFADAIQYRDDFLHHYPYFLILHTVEIFPGSLMRTQAIRVDRNAFVGDPLVQRFSADPAYQVKPYKTMKLDNLEQSLFLVCRHDFSPCDVNALAHQP